MMEIRWRKGNFEPAEQGDPDVNAAEVVDTETGKVVGMASGFNGSWVATMDHELAGQYVSTSHQNPQQVQAMYERFIARVEGHTVIQLLGLCNGVPTGFDGQWLVEYDPGKPGTDPLTGTPMVAHIATTPDRAQATKFTSDKALETIRAVDPRRPTRFDGRPNRPITAFNILMERA